MSKRYGPEPLPDGEVLARMAGGWRLVMSRGVMYFGIFLKLEAETVSVNRPCFTRLRDEGLIRYVTPLDIRLTKRGLKAAEEWRSRAALSAS